MGLKVNVFDTSALMRYLDREEGHLRVADLLLNSALGNSRAIIPAVNWGELTYVVYLKYGAARALGLEELFSVFRLVVVPLSATRAQRTGLIKATMGFGYADCFGIELATDSPDHTLITADFGVKPAESQVRIEFLPPKPKPQ